MNAFKTMFLVIGVDQRVLCALFRTTTANIVPFAVPRAAMVTCALDTGIAQMGFATVIDATQPHFSTFVDCSANEARHHRLPTLGLAAIVDACFVLKRFGLVKLA